MAGRTAGRPASQPGNQPPSHPTVFLVSSLTEAGRLMETESWETAHKSKWARAAWLSVSQVRPPSDCGSASFRHRFGRTTKSVHDTLWYTRSDSRSGSGASQYPLSEREKEELLEKFHLNLVSRKSWRTWRLKVEQTKNKSQENAHARICASTLSYTVDDFRKMCLFSPAKQSESIALFS